MNFRGLNVIKKIGAIEISSGGGVVGLSHTEVQALIDYLISQLPLIIEDSKKKQSEELVALEQQFAILAEEIKRRKEELKT